MERGGEGYGPSLPAFCTPPGWSDRSSLPLEPDVDRCLLWKQSWLVRVAMSSAAMHRGG